MKMMGKSNRHMWVKLVVYTWVIYHQGVVIGMDAVFAVRCDILAVSHPCNLKLDVC